MRTTLFVACILVSASSSRAQTIRIPVQVDTTTPPGFAVMGPGIASSGDLSVAVFNDDVNNRVWAVLSDGRGVEWSAPVQVDSDPIGGLKESGETNRVQNVAISGDNVYVNWIDERNGGIPERDVYFARSTDRGQTWQEQRLDKGFPMGSGVGVVERCMAVSSSLGVTDTIFVVMTVLNPSGNEELYMVSSIDSGVTFSNAIPVSTANAAVTDVDGFNVAANGFFAHVVWTDDRAGSTAADDVWYRRSADGGASFQPEIQLDSSGPLLGDASLEPVITVDGQLVAVIWEEELASATNEECRVAVSTDGGVTFNPDTLVGQYTSADDIDAPNIAICGGNIVAAWDDNRLGSDAVFVSYSSNNGATWQPDVQVSSLGGPGFGKLTADASGVMSVTSEATPGNVAEVSWSRDCGVTWTAPAQISNNTGDVDRIRTAYNPLYDNFVSVWEADDAGLNNLFIGGFRTPTLTKTPPLTVPNVQLSFSLSDFEPVANRFFWVLLSGAPGNLPLAPIDERNLGLQFDGLLLTSVQVPALFFGPLDTQGQGGTPSFTLAAPSGTALFAAAVSFTVSGPSVTVHEITDVIDVSVQ